MSEPVRIPDFNSPIAAHARKDFPLLDAKMTVTEALERIRREGVGERVIYFFAVDTEERLERFTELVATAIAVLIVRPAGLLGRA